MKKYLQLLLALTMLKPSPINSEKYRTFNYMSFGDSQTTGLGLHGFVPEEFYENPSLYFTGESGMMGAVKDGYYGSGYVFNSEESYPKLVKKELEKTHRNVNHIQGAINGMRAVDLDIMINQKEEDIYKMFLVDGYIEDIEPARHDEIVVGGKTYVHEKEKTSVYEDMITGIENADLITYDLGANDFGGYLLIGQFASWMEQMGVKVADMYRVMPEEYADIYYNVKGYLLSEVLTSLGGILPDDVLSMVNDYLDIFAYALLGYMSSFDSTMERIFELNPDVEVVVCTIQNIYEGTQMEIAGGTVIPFGDVVGAMMTIANTYTKYFSPFAEKYYVADFGTGHVEDYFAQMKSWANKGHKLGSLLEFGDFIDCMDVYSSFQIKHNLKKQLAAEANVVAEDGTVLTYDDIMALDKKVAENRELQARLQKELNVKSQVAYYTFARTFSIAAENATMTLNSWGGDAFNDIYPLAVEHENLFDASLSEKANLDNIIPQVEAAVVASFGGSENAVRAQQVFTQCAQAGFANAVMLHRNANGHQECADKVMEAYRRKITKREFNAKDLISALPKIIDFDEKKAAAVLADVLFRVNAFVVGGTINEPIIISTVNDLLGFLDSVEAFVAENAEIIDQIKSMGAELIEMLGVSEEVKAFLEENPALSYLVENAEEVINSAIEVGRTSLKILEFVEILRNTFVGHDVAALVTMAGEATAATTMFMVKSLANMTSYLSEKIQETMKVAAELTVAISARMNEVTKYVINGAAEALHSAIVATGIVIEKGVEAAKDAAEKTISAIRFTVNEAVEFARLMSKFAVNTAEKIVEINKNAVKAAENLAKAAIEATISGTREAIEKAANLAAEIVNVTIKAAKNVNEQVKQGVAYTIDAISKAYDLVKDLTKDGIEGLIRVTSTVISFVGEKLSDAAEAILNLAGTIYSRFDSAVKDVAELISSLFENMFRTRKTTVKEVKAYVAEASEEAVETVEVVEETIVRAVKANRGAPTGDKTIEEVYEKFLANVLALTEDVNTILGIIDTVEAFNDATYDKLNHIVSLVMEFGIRLEEFTKGAITMIYNHYSFLISQVTKLVNGYVDEIISWVNDWEGDIEGLECSLFMWAPVDVLPSFNPAEYCIIGSLNSEVAKLCNTFIGIGSDIVTIENTIMTAVGFTAYNLMNSEEQISEAIEFLLLKWNLVEPEAE